MKRTAGQAAGAPAARLRERPNDPVANTDLGHIGTNGDHDSGNFVADDGRLRRDVMCGEEQVRMAQT